MDFPIKLLSVIDFETTDVLFCKSVVFLTASFCVETAEIILFCAVAVCTVDPDRMISLCFFFFDLFGVFFFCNRPIILLKQ